MRIRELTRMARHAARSIIFGRLLCLIVRVVTGGAPEATLAASRASAQRKLFNVADYFQARARRVGRERQGVSGENFSKVFSRMKISEVHSGVQDPGNTFEVALFADTIARRGCKIRGIHD